MLFKRGVVLLICIIMAFGMYVPASAASYLFNITLFFGTGGDSTTEPVTVDNANPVVIESFVGLTRIYNSKQYELVSVVIIDGRAGSGGDLFTGAQVAGGATYTFATDYTGYDVSAHYRLSGGSGTSGSKGGNGKHIPVPIGFFGIDWEKDFTSGKTYKFSTLPESARLDFAAGDFEKRGQGEGFMHADEDGYFYIKPLKKGKLKLKFSSTGFIDREITINVK